MKTFRGEEQSWSQNFTEVKWLVFKKTILRGFIIFQGGGNRLLPIETLIICELTGGGGEGGGVRSPVPHSGSTHKSAFTYQMKDKNENIYELTPVNSEKDLGITFQHDMKFDIHINNIVNKANRLLGLVKRTFSYMDRDTFFIIYKSIIRPIIDYGDSVWNPSLKKHIQMIENIQRRGTKLVPELININYTDRLKMLNLPTLKYRRKRGDLIQVFKILNGHYDINWEDFFTLDIVFPIKRNSRGGGAPCCPKAPPCCPKAPPCCPYFHFNIKNNHILIFTV